MKASVIISDVSRDLNDAVTGYQYTRWTQAQLQTYYREAYSTVSKGLREPFIHTDVVKVQSGGGWQSACAHCTTILRILYECTSTGTPIGPLVNATDASDVIWTGPFLSPCMRAHSADYQMRSYTLSTTDSNKFMINPPVPSGTTKYVMVECYSEPNLDNMNEDVPDHFVAAIKQWMLFRALSVDSENNPAIMQLAAQHRDTHFELLKTLISLREKEWSDQHDTVRAIQNPPAK
mgnify:CR=1 FL=1